MQVGEKLVGGNYKLALQHDFYTKANHLFYICFVFIEIKIEFEIEFEVAVEFDNSLVFHHKIPELVSPQNPRTCVISTKSNVEMVNSDRWIVIG